MANKRAKRIVKEVFERENLVWSITQEQSWLTCVRHGYFKDCTSVWDYLYYLLPPNISVSVWYELRLKYRKQPLPW